jgi:endonuclease/exonuclease/phosphatase (EEP) superfamily protein YafD
LLFVYCVHLKSNRGIDIENVALREESMRQLRAHISAMQAAYAKLGRIATIVGGDFNTSIDDKRFAAEKTLRDFMSAGFAWALQNLSPAARETLPAGNGFPAANFDHIFYQGAKLKRAFIGRTSARSSDHRPVAATFEME